MRRRSFIYRATLVVSFLHSTKGIPMIKRLAKHLLSSRASFHHFDFRKAYSSRLGTGSHVAPCTKRALKRTTSSLLGRCHNTTSLFLNSHARRSPLPTSLELRY